MTKLYKRSEILFAVSLITVYVVGGSIADSLSESIGMAKSVTAVFFILMSAVIFLWIKKNGHMERFGLCPSVLPPVRLLYYIPLAVLSSVNLWFGLRMGMPIPETVFYVISMICVGFLEEVIFRGFLFRAMEKDGVRSAIAVSSITFGVGHIVNLFNGSGAGVVENLCQIISAVCIGFLFVTVFYKSGSLIPCIISHSVINSLSAFVNDAAVTDGVNVALSLFMCVLSASYAVAIMRAPPRER